MATGRTISASFLTKKDEQILDLCGKISDTIVAGIANDEDKKRFVKEYGKISKSRDAGLGLGGGKLQRDALCTRGIQGKLPFSNRNLILYYLISVVMIIK